MKHKDGLEQTVSDLTEVAREYARRVSEQERAAHALIESCEGRSPEEIAEAYRALPLSLVINTGSSIHGEVLVEERPWEADSRRVVREYGLLLTPAAIEGITSKTPVLEREYVPINQGASKLSFVTKKLKRIIPLDELTEEGKKTILKSAEYAKRKAEEVQSGELKLEDLHPDEVGDYLMRSEQPLMGVPLFVSAYMPFPDGDRPHRIRMLSNCSHNHGGEAAIKEAYRLCGKDSVIELYAMGVHVGDLTPTGPRIPDEHLINVARYFSEDIMPRDRLSKAFKSSG